jgi:Tfp pilus assembly protein PilF/predicted Ser/Thr protein kinase
MTTPTTCSNCSHAIEDDARFCPSCGTRLVRGGEQEPLIGKTLNAKYRVLSKIGRGGMGTVYLGEHIGLRKKVALKVLRPDLQVSEETLRRFQREGIAAGKFTHANAIQIFDFDRADEGVFYLAMEYVEGADLKAYLRETGRLDTETAIDITGQVLAALAEAHRHGIVHRDLKPENIMVVRSTTGSLSVKVLDFGLSKLIDVPTEGASLQTHFGQIVGTPLYMAPEQGSAENVDHRSDLYAVGLILYELLSGQSPFRGLSVPELLVKHVTAPPQPINDVHTDLQIPADLEDLLIRVLERKPEERFQSAAEMIAALEEVDPARSARRRRRRSTAQKGAQGNRMRLLLAVAAVLAVGALAWRLGASGFGDAEPEGPVRVSAKAASKRTEEEARYVRLLEEARARLAAGDIQAANVSVEDAHRLTCRDEEAFFVRAMVYRAREDADPALADLREALRIDPTYADAAAVMGWIELERGAGEVARERFEQAEELDEESALALAGLGALARSERDSARAQEFFERAVAIDPACAPAQRELGLLRLAEDDFEGAVEALTEAKRIDPLMWRTWVALGEVYLELDRQRDAENQFARAVELGPDAAEPLELYASFLIEAGRHAEALEHLEPAVQSHPHWSRVQALTGLAHHGVGSPDQAALFLQRGVDAGEQDARALTMLGVLRQESGRLDEARALYDQAIEQDGRFALPHMNNGLVLFAQERYAEAQRELQMAVDLDATNAFAHFSLGIVCMDYTGDRQKAAESLTAYRELGGGDPRVAGWLRRIGAN